MHPARDAATWSCPDPNPDVKPHSYTFDRRDCLSCDTCPDVDDDDKDSECACTYNDGTDPTPRATPTSYMCRPRSSAPTSAPGCACHRSLSAPHHARSDLGDPIPTDRMVVSPRASYRCAGRDGTRDGVRVGAGCKYGCGRQSGSGATSPFGTEAGGGTRPPERNEGHKERSSGSDADEGERCGRTAAACPILVSFAPTANSRVR